MRVAEAIAPMTLDEFRECYLDQQWLLIEGSPDRYRPLVPWSDLNTALGRLRIPKGSKRLRLVKDGKTVPGDTYLRHAVSGSAVRTGAFERHLSEGATLVLNGVNELFPEVRELTDDADETLGAFASANLYAGWRTQQGFDLHWDDHDTVILQVYGRKAWTVYGPTCDFPTKAFVGSWTPPKDPPIWQGVLKAGSVLYMPRGWWHYAVPLDEPTLHVTVGLEYLGGEDLLQWAATQLHSRPVFRANVPYRTGFAGRQAYLAELREAVVGVLSDGCLERMRKHTRARAPRFPVPGLPEAIAPEPVIQPESVLLLAEARELDITPLPDGRMSVAVNGGQWTCSAGLAATVARLGAVRGCRFDELSAGLTPAQRLELKIVLTAMLHKGELVQRRDGVPPIAAAAGASNAVI